MADIEINKDIDSQNFIELVDDKSWNEFMPNGVTKDVFKKGYSSKEVKSGIGLWEVKKLIDKSGNSQIYASIEKNQFIQNIIIEK